MPHARWQAAPDGAYWIDLAIGSREILALVDLGLIDSHDRVGLSLEPSLYDALKQAGELTQFFTDFRLDASGGIVQRENGLLTAQLITPATRQRIGPTVSIHASRGAAGVPNRVGIAFFHRLVGSRVIWELMVLPLRPGKASLGSGGRNGPPGKGWLPGRAGERKRGLVDGGAGCGHFPDGESVRLLLGLGKAEHSFRQLRGHFHQERLDVIQTPINLGELPLHSIHVFLKALLSKNLVLQQGGRRLLHGGVILNHKRLRLDERRHRFVELVESAVTVWFARHWVSSSMGLYRAGDREVLRLFDGRTGTAEVEIPHQPENALQPRHRVWHPDRGKPAAFAAGPPSEPMAVLGDDSAANLRRAMLEAGTFRAIEAFPQKDDPKRRVFPEAKLSTAVFILTKDKSAENDLRPFRSRVHSGRLLEEDSPGLLLTTAAIPLYDPSNFTIVSCSQADWDLAARIMGSGRMARLKQFAEFFQGEVNETNERAKGNLTSGASTGKQVTRGACICLYVLRDASQGKEIWLDVKAFLHGKKPDAKAFHHLHPRIGLQENSPQNNFRRIIAAHIPANEFCNHTVNYCPGNKASIDLSLLTALLNSKLADWYFRLGSTNAHVSHYQLYNLPCPIFADGKAANGASTKSNVQKAMRAGDAAKALELLKPLCAQPPFSPVIRDVIIEAVNQISGIEKERGEIARSARSALDPSAQLYQDLIDQLLYRMAGLNDAEIIGLEQRHSKML